MAATTSSSRKRKQSTTNPTDPLLGRLSSVATVTRSFLEANDLFLPPSQSLRLESLLSSLPSPSQSPSSTTWFHRFVTSAVELDDPRWYICFRMSRSTFFNLISVLSLPSSSVAATIFRLAHGASYKSLLLRFGFNSIADASRAFFTVCKQANEKLSRRLHDPKPDYLPNLLPNCCGVLGFGRFKVNGELLDSVLVQALLDSNCRFVDISAGWPSTMKPEAIFRQTKLAESSSFLNGASCKLADGVLVPRYVIGDSCLPLLPWLLIPFGSEEDSLDAARSEFNDVVHSALETVDVAFAKVRARWRILDEEWKPETVEFLPFVITTCCLLHNFLVDSGDEGLVNDVVAGGGNGEMGKEEEDEETRRSEGEAYIGSTRIRDAVAQNLSRISSLT